MFKKPNKLSRLLKSTSFRLSAVGLNPASSHWALMTSRPSSPEKKKKQGLPGNTGARDLNVIFVSLGASVQAGLDSCPCILLVRICMCFEFLYVFVRLPDLNTDTSYQKKILMQST